MNVIVVCHKVYSAAGPVGRGAYRAVRRIGGSIASHAVPLAAGTAVVTLVCVTVPGWLEAQPLTPVGPTVTLPPPALIGRPALDSTSSDFGGFPPAAAFLAPGTFDALPVAALTTVPPAVPPPPPPRGGPPIRISEPSSLAVLGLGVLTLGIVVFCCRKRRPKEADNGNPRG
jgi:hypothetical protein